MRRKLILEDLNAVLNESRRLLQLGYSRKGNWSLGQICKHIRLTIDANVEGYPFWMIALGYPLRPILRRFLLPRLLRGDSPTGIPTASRFVPPSDLVDSDEVSALEASIQRFQSTSKPLKAHPGFGRLSKDSFERFHAAHAAHHLSFLDAKLDEGECVG